MTIHIEDTGDELVYRIEAATEPQRAVLTASVFAEANGVFTKKFAKATLMFDHDPQVLAANFERHLGEQTNPADRCQRFESALDWVCRAHRDAGVRWWMCGSGALYARGLDVVPHDLDVMVDKTEILRVRDVVAGSIVEPFHHVTGWVVRGFGVVSHDFRIDYAFEPEAWVDGQGAVDFGPTAGADLEEVSWRGHRLLVPRLTYHLPSNRARQRWKVVEQIERSLGESPLPQSI